jgi:hypothetical protein
VQPNPHTNWVLALRGVRTRVRRDLPSLFLPPTTTKRRKQSNPPKPSFNPKREVRKEIPKPTKEAFVCMFCSRAGHLDEFCFRRKRIEKRLFNYARNSYHDEFYFPPRSYSHTSPRTSSHALSCFSHEPNHHSYGFGS